MSEITFASIESSHQLVRFLIVLGLCSERLMVLMMIFPPTSDNVVQGRVRTALALLWGSFIAYGQRGLLEQGDATMLVGIGLKEALIGVGLGFAASAVFWAAESVGTYVDDLTGFNQLQMQNPSQGQQTSLTSTLLSQFAIAAFWCLGGMTFLLGAIYESYTWWPLANLTPAGGSVLESFVLTKTDSLMETVAKLATPMMLMLLLIDIGFGFTGKVSQKLDLPSLAQPVKGALTILMLALMAAIFIDQVRDQLSLVGIAAEARALAGSK
ncbi:type III secretion system export apparatus subunit SctT [Burkholderia dolosa]|jgi:type III secretion protein T|uniref:type III secretion system export apparatus subunit SctT n=1 Tax=Burkholderia dolosa TaxID=152500 RepID=UPI001B9E9F7B|nr:type III secretion system export apparatus subunit SctT [Burkholderia dolosa]MBR8058290.1 type III secretion system export apparatus subunit SctT [Burkholderia dolosa]MBR8302491.1 type III secretion system export apparatus subunit SctT [Burkholderia dolosa]MBR8316611.1 type III secretion system export apparatus subunit SctT [Burkholderia dolosa]MBR8456645.1 type III secretion system export apparatus subunit SctT [Burkholderia dolosa]